MLAQRNAKVRKNQVQENSNVQVSKMTKEKVSKNSKCQENTINNTVVKLLVRKWDLRSVHLVVHTKIVTNKKTTIRTCRIYCCDM